MTIMQNTNRSPQINHVSWGRLEVEGEAEPYKDAKLFPGGSREWNWRETLDFLKGRQIAVHVLPTQHAVALYNKLAQTEPVAGLFHTTC